MYSKTSSDTQSGSSKTKYFKEKALKYKLKYLNLKKSLNIFN